MRLASFFAKHVPFIMSLAICATTVFAEGDPACRLLAAIDAPPDLVHHMNVMLQRSQTFRQQCRRLEAAGVHLSIRMDPHLIDRMYRAQTVIARLSTGEVTAKIAITPFGNPTEWVAHEFEHVLEQIDRVDVRRLAVLGQKAWGVGDAYETARAIHAGQIVKAEVRDSRRRAAAVRSATATGGDD
jgi:hypothetical protein